MSPLQSAPISNLPDRNPFFTGREWVLTQLQEALAAQGRAALSGLGGIGKTQTALEYAHRHLDEYVYTFWAPAASREVLASGYVMVAGLLKLSEPGAQDQTLAVDALKRWLGSHDRWLLILDNTDDISMAREFIPPGNNGHVILTTRARATGAIAQRLDIEEMGTEEGALFLLRRAGCIGDNARLESTVEADRSTAEKITTQLDGLPLALDQAAAYIEETACGLSSYIDLYRNHAPELLGRRGVLPPDHPDPVATTWALSFENIEKASPAAADLLRFCAFLDPDAIPEEVFRDGAPELGPELQTLGSDAFALNDALSEILKYSLLRRDPNARTLKIHRLVQAVLKQGMDEATQRLWAERAVRTVGCTFPLVEFSTWPVCERLLPQALACTELINQWGFEFREAAKLLNDVGLYLSERGHYNQAAAPYKRALEIRKKVLGPNDPATLCSRAEIASWTGEAGDAREALRLFGELFPIQREVLGAKHPETLRTRNNLAHWTGHTGDVQTALDLCNALLPDRERVLG